MELVQVSMDVPKEAKEVVDAMSAVIAHFAAKKSLADAAALLPALLKAAEGIGNVADEVKSQYKDELSAYLLKSVWGALSPQA